MNLVESVRDSGGEVKIFSSMHISGERKLNLNHFSLLNTKRSDLAMVPMYAFKCK